MSEERIKITSLPKMENIGADDQFIVSNKEHDNTFKSKKMSYGDMKENLKKDEGGLSIHHILEDLKNVHETKHDISSLDFDHWIYADNNCKPTANYGNTSEKAKSPSFNPENPYHIYGIYQNGKNGSKANESVVSVAVNPLSNSMSSIFGRVVFENISANTVTIKGYGGLKYSGIQTKNNNQFGSVWFSDAGNNGTPVVSDKLKYNSADNKLSVGSIIINNHNNIIPDDNSKEVLNSHDIYDSMYSHFMGGHSKNNPLATKDFVNSSINGVAAFYIQYKENIGGDTYKYRPFKTYKELSSAELSDIYCGECHSSPTRNDYCVVLSDETISGPYHNFKNPTPRYVFTDVSSTSTDYDKRKISAWTYQYTVNESPFTDAQWKSINSGITEDNRVIKNSSEGIGSETNPVYVDNGGYVKPIHSYGGTAYMAECDISGRSIVSTYLNTTDKITLDALLVSVDTKNGYTDKSIVPKSYIDKNFIGQNGDIVYASPNGNLKNQLLNSDLFICETDEEIQAAKEFTISFKDVFDNWIKGGHNTKKWYGYDEYPSLRGDGTLDDYGYGYWYYDDSISSIVQPKNTLDDSFYTSRQKYSNYDMTVRMYSTNKDDDVNGLILSFVEDNAGKPHYLAAIRTPNVENTEDGSLICKYHWYISKDFTWLFSNTSTDMVSCNDVVGDEYKAPSANGGWNWNGAGTTIRARRAENKISVWTTPFKKDCTVDYAKDPEKLGTMLSVDLSNIYGGLFAKPGRVGYCTKSQPQSKYENINIELEKSIIDTRDNSLSTYNPNTRQWELKSTGFNTLSACGFGRICKNTTTNKCFFVGQNSFQKIGSQNATEIPMSNSYSTTVYKAIMELSTMVGASITRLEGILG